MNSYALRSCFLAAVLALGACDGEVPATAPRPTAAALTDTVVAVEKKRPRELLLDGLLEAMQKSTISAQTPARVVELPVDVGDVVEQGQVIARLRDVDAQARSSGARAGLAEARARLAEAEVSYQRARDVWERKLIARAQFDRAEAEYKSAQARVAAAEAAGREAQEGVDYTVVRAPYAGIVLERHVEVGEIAAVGTPLITGVSLAQLRVAVEVPEQSIGAVRRGGQARVLLADGRSLQVQALRIPPSADTRTHSFRVLVELPAAAPDLFPGTLVKVAFSTGETRVLAVPSAAVVRRGEITGLYVLGAQERLSFRYVRLGGTDADGDVEVLSGLAAGERVALDPVRAAQIYGAGAAAGAGA